MPMPDSMPLATAVWRRVDVPDGLGHGCIVRTADGFRLWANEIVHDEQATYSVTFTVETDTTWATTAMHVATMDTADRRELSLKRAASGRWSSDGQERADLEGCVDVDVAATPLTNTLPINRLELEVGETATLSVAWVDVPSLEVGLSRQRYERLLPHGDYECYVYSDDTYGPYILAVDRNGMVTEYEGLARRV